MEISLTSFGSSQTLPRPHLRTLEARRFCNLRETMFRWLFLTVWAAAKANGGMEWANINLGFGTLFGLGLFHLS